MSMLVLAFLLPFLTWVQAAGCALLALSFNVFILPYLDVDHRATGPSVSRRMNRWLIDLYPVSVLVLILVYRHHMEIVAAAWAIMALGDGMASVIGQAFGGPLLPWNREKTWSGFLGFVGAGTLGAYVLTRWVNPALPADGVLRVCAATALVGALVETVPIRLDDNVSVPLVAGGFMFCALLMERSALASNLPYLGRRVVLASVVNLVFALLALALKMVDRSGAACGFMLGAAVYLGYGYRSFSVMLVFFVVASW